MLLLSVFHCHLYYEGVGWRVCEKEVSALDGDKVASVHLFRCQDTGCQGMRDSLGLAEEVHYRQGGQGLRDPLVVG